MNRSQRWTFRSSAGRQFIEGIARRKRSDLSFLSRMTSPMVKYISDRIGVMHYGRLLEVGPADDVYNKPLHDYTASLISAVPEPDPEFERNRKQKNTMLRSKTIRKASRASYMRSRQDIMFVVLKMRSQCIKLKLPVTKNKSK